MGIFFLFESPTFSLAGGNDLSGQFFRHAAAIPLTAVTDQPFYAQRDLPIRTHFRGDLEGSSTDTTAAYFYSRGDIGQGPFPDIVPLFVGLLADPIHGIVKDI